MIITFDENKPRLFLKLQKKNKLRSEEFFSLVENRTSWNYRLNVGAT